MVEPHWLGPDLHARAQEPTWEYPAPIDTARPVNLLVSSLRGIHRAFVDTAANLDLADVAVPYLAAKPIPARTLEQASLVAVVARDRALERVCPQSAGYDFAYPGTTDRQVGFTDVLALLDVYVDGHMGVILKKGQRPIACVSGSLTAHGPIIQQVQGLRYFDEQRTPQLRLLDWRLTAVNGLIKLWQRTLPSQMLYMQGRPVMMQAAMNNRWVTEVDPGATEPSNHMRGRVRARRVGGAKYARFERIYDGTAIEMGARSTDLYGNYILPEENNIPTLSER